MALTQVTSIGIKNGEIVNADLHSAAAIVLSKLNTTGTASSSTFLRGDGAWTAMSADGGNAATLDSIDSSQFLRSDAADSYTGTTLNFNNSTDQKIILSGSTNPYIRWQEGTTNRGYLQFYGTDDKFYWINEQADTGLRLGSSLNWLSGSSSWHNVWHAGNDGSGSGLDADKLDGSEATKFLSSYDRTTTTGWEDSNRNFRINGGSTGSAGLAFHDSAGTFQWQIYGASGNSEYGFLNANWCGWDIRKIAGGALYVNSASQVWHQGNDGSGSGLDADTLDGRDSNTGSVANTIALRDSSSNLTGAGFISTGGTTDGLVGLAYGTNYFGLKTSSQTLSSEYMIISANADTYISANSGYNVNIRPGGNSSTNQLTVSTTGARIGGNLAWHAGNDGSGSGLDADTLDGVQGSSYLRSDASDSLTAGTLTVRDILFTSGFTLQRSSHQSGNLEGGHNNIGGTSTKTSPIYTIGANYNPAESSLSNMYGIGFSHTDASFITTTGPSGWGQYVAADGDARVFLCGSNGSIWSTNQHYVGSNVVWNAGNDGSGSGLDADSVDGIAGSSFLRSDADDTFTGGLVSSARDEGIFGVYDSYKTDHIWSMGTGYKNHSSGTNFGDLYGLAYKHVNNSTGGTMGGSHQMVWCHNGGARGAIGYNQVWHAEAMRVTSSNHLVMHAGNDGSGSGFDADLLDGTEASGFVKQDNNSFHVLRFGSGSNSGHARSSYPYAIFQETGAWSTPYPDLCISYHTGIKIGCGHQSYGGLRFTPDYNSETILMSINNGTETNGTGNVKVNTKLYVSGVLDCSTTVKCDDWYYNDTGGEGLYSSANGMHWYADATTALNAAGGTSANWIRFRDESGGTVRGYVGANSSNLTGFLDHNGSWRFYITSTYCATVNNFIPNADNTYDCGLSNARWDDIYATNGTIQTSDRNEKENIVATDLGLAFVNKLSPKSFKRKGKNRTHYGFIAQDIEQIIADLGKTTTQFAPLIKSDISEEKDGSKYSYGLRYDELLAPIVKAIQELAVKVAALESA